MNTLFKKSLMSTALILMSTGAMASSDTAPFMWSGVHSGVLTPAEFCINMSSVFGEKKEFNSGKLEFETNKDDATKSHITSSTLIGFTVVERNPNDNSCTGKKIPFQYQLTKIDLDIYSNNGLTQKPLASDEVNNWSVMHAKAPNAQNIGLPTKLPVNGGINRMRDGGHVGLSVAGDTLDVQEGDNAVIQAFILVSDQIS